jgi:hypothetical protein
VRLIPLGFPGDGLISGDEDSVALVDSAVCSTLRPSVLLMPFGLCAEGGVVTGSGCSSRPGSGVILESVAGFRPPRPRLMPLLVPLMASGFLVTCCY